jgi:hypothetical protein
MNRLTFVIIKIVLLCLLPSAAVHGQKTDTSILNRSVEIDSRFHANIWSAIHDLASQGIPIGFEAAEGWTVDMGPRLLLKSGPLFEVLNSIGRQDTSYSWKEIDGVINFFPSRNRNKRSASFLEMRIGAMIVKKGADRASVVEGIRKLADSSGETDFNFASAIGAGNQLGLPDKVGEELIISDSSMRTVLNRLIKVQSYRPIWSVVQYSNQDNLTLVF